MTLSASTQPMFSDFADGTDFILVVTGEPDRNGAEQHFAFWVGMVGYSGDEVGIKGQVFLCPVDEHVARITERGKTVKVWQ